MAGGWLELWLWVVVLLQQSARQGNAVTKALHKAEHPHGLRQIGVAIIGHSRLSEGLHRHLAKRSAGIHDLDSIIEPVDTRRRVSTFIDAVQNRVARQLLKGSDGVVGAATLGGCAGNVDMRAIVAVSFSSSCRI